MSAKDLFARLFLFERLSWEILNVPATAVALAAVKGQPVDAQRLVSDVVQRAHALALDCKRLEQLLMDYVAEVRSWVAEVARPIEGTVEVGIRNRKAESVRPAERALREFLQKHYDLVESELSAIPSSPEKAQEALRAFTELPFLDDRDLYEAAVVLRDEVSPSLVTNVVAEWKELNRLHGEAVAAGEEPPSALFWTSRDFEEIIDSITRYRFCEAFHVHDFPEMMEQVEGMAASAIMEGYSGIEAVVASHTGDTFVHSIAFNLWLISRSPRLRAKIDPAIRMAVHRLVNSQAPEGYWPEFGMMVRTKKRQSRLLPSPFTTALAAVSMLRLQMSKPSVEAALRATRWLLQTQSGDGFWSIPVVRNRRLEHQAHLLTTIFSVEALLRSDLGGVDRSAELALTWLRGQQSPLGMWEDNVFGRVLPTVLVLELEKLATRSRVTDLPYLMTARAFLLQAMRLNDEDTPGARQLAIIAAAHAVEAFLYGALSQPSINKPIFAPGGQTTIGLRRALDALEDAIRSQSQSTAPLDLRNEMDRLAWLRDQVVHKALVVDTAECREYVFHARAFIERYHGRILGRDLWEA